MLNEFDWHQQAEKMWDDQAEFWNQRSTNMWDNGSRKQIVPFIRKHLSRGSSIVDVGCGDGYGSYKLSQSGYHVTGIDISSEMIKLAKTRHQQGNLKFMQGDIANLPMRDASIDSLMAINVIEWTESPADVLAAFHRVLRKDGVLFAGILGPTAGPRMNSYPRLHGDQTICNTMMPWEFQQLASDTDFEYIDGFGVYKQDVRSHHYKDLPLELQQALTFMWVFKLRKVGD